MAPTRYVPPQSLCIRSKQSTAVVYLYMGRTGKPTALGYAGRTIKPLFIHNFGSEAIREAWVADWIRKQDAKEAEKVALRVAPCSLEVGDVLAASWGYEQTNVDFYQVVRRMGAQMVGLRPIQCEKHADGDMTGYVVPLVNEFTGPEFRKTVSAGGYVRINSHTFAKKAERITGANGEQLGFRPQRFTSYA